MRKVKVAVNGYGVIGKRVADAGEATGGYGISRRGRCRD